MKVYTRSLRPDMPMYETDGNLKPIRHPEAQHVTAMMDEWRRHQELLENLWRAEWAYARLNSVNSTYDQRCDAEGAIGLALAALGPPPEPK